MHLHHNREITINKKQLIDKIAENREIHINEYKDAVIAYRKEATKQLKKLAKDIKNGEIGIRLELVAPVDRSSEYDKVIEMFNWEVSDTVTLEQREFNEYVHDENSQAVSARMFNSTYTNK